MSMKTGLKPQEGKNCFLIILQEFYISTVNTKIIEWIMFSEKEDILRSYNNGTGKPFPLLHMQLSADHDCLALCSWQ